jgi:peroxiredoxin Q/BCP
LAEYRDAYPQIRALGYELVAISVDPPAVCERLRRELHLPFAILCDVNREIVKQWNVYNARERGGIAKPSAFIIESDGTVRTAITGSVAKRERAQHLLRMLQEPHPVLANQGIMPRWGDFKLAIQNNIAWR